MKKESFLLIEAIIAIMLLSFSIIALLKLNGNIINVLTHLQTKEQIYQDSSAIVSLLTKDYNKKTKSVYDILKKRYNIDNLDIKHNLQDTKYSFKIENFAHITFGDFFDIDIQKVTIKEQNNQIIIYKLNADG